MRVAEARTFDVLVHEPLPGQWFAAEAVGVLLVGDGSRWSLALHRLALAVGRHHPGARLRLPAPFDVVIDAAAIARS